MLVVRSSSSEAGQGESSTWKQMHTCNKIISSTQFPMLQYDRFANFKPVKTSNIPTFAFYNQRFPFLFVFWICFGTVQSQSSFKYNSALRKWQWEGNKSSTDFSQIPRQWWGQSLQTSVFTSYWQTAAAAIRVHGCPVPSTIYNHVTTNSLTSEHAKEEKENRYVMKLSRYKLLWKWFCSF